MRIGLPLLAVFATSACADELLVPLVELEPRAQPRDGPWERDTEPAVDASFTRPLASSERALPAPRRRAAVWVLVGMHDPFPAEGQTVETGLHLVDLDRGVVERTLPLPDASAQWTAVADVGEQLLLARTDLAGRLDHCLLVWIDEHSGVELRRISGICAEGLALDADGALWVSTSVTHLDEATGAAIWRIDEMGNVLDDLRVPVPPSDLASDGDRLFWVTYYLEPGVDNPWLTALSRDGSQQRLAQMYPRFSGVPFYGVASLSSDVLLACVYPNECRTLAAQDGVDLGPASIAVDGWITGLSASRN